LPRAAGYLPGMKTFPAVRFSSAFTTALLASVLTASAAQTFRVAEYNVENYLDAPTETRKFVKSAEAKAKIRESIKAANPDVLALEEMGTTNALLELQASLKADGLDLPFWEHISGYDTNIHVAVLSKFPFTARRPHTNDVFLLNGRRFDVSRGFAEVDVQVSTNFQFTLLAAHLKSKRPVGSADEAELRVEEAKLFREKVDALFHANPAAKLIVLGDFNDTHDSKAIKEVVGKNKFKLVDTRPAERNGDTSAVVPHREPRRVMWTHYFAVEDTYSRIDYIMLSPALAKFWNKDATHIVTVPDWGVGSDHRPLVAEFTVK
jgi:endonuclease/exonuclease/phosphatase family metal-dependent hydrolase